MKDAARLAGFFGAHAIWSVHEGGALFPTLAYADSAGKMGTETLEEEDEEKAVRRGRTKLANGAEGIARAVLVYDGTIDLDGEKTDALFLEARTYGEDAVAFMMAVPYRRAEAPGGFAVFRPKFLAIEGIEEKDLGMLSHAFFEGVENHDDGSVVWRAYSKTD
ncbi:hypothetical protein SCOR_16330 [Sulfidibacter corallicola]